MRNIRQNLVFAFGYNALGVPIAAGVLYPAFGLLLSPDDREPRDELVVGVRDRQRAAVASHSPVAILRHPILRASAEAGGGR